MSWRGHAPYARYGRFEYGIPPKKNGGYAFLLHILASLTSIGKGAVIHPHGVLFRGGAREAVKALCEPVEQPKDSAAYLHYFCAQNSGNADELKDNEPKRLKLYKYTATLLRAFASLANEFAAAGYAPDEIERIKAEVDHYSKVRDEVRLASGDYIDLKAYEPAMRYLIDTYIRAEDSEKISAFDDMSLIQLIVERGPDAVNALPKGIKKSEDAIAETIENNVRRLIINESPVDPAYYERMSKLLDALIEQRRKGVVS